MAAYYNEHDPKTAAWLRSYCSLPCANTSGNWGKSSTASHRASQKAAKSACERCGKAGRLHVHHRDGDYHNKRN